MPLMNWVLLLSLALLKWEMLCMILTSCLIEIFQSLYWVSLLVYPRVCVNLSSCSFVSLL
jgi:hypothetical protein